MPRLNAVVGSCFVSSTTPVASPVHVAIDEEMVNTQFSKNLEAPNLNTVPKKNWSTSLVQHVGDPTFTMQF